MTAVLGTSSGWTGTWWYPRTRSTLEKMVAPCQVGGEVLYMQDRIPVGGCGVVQVTEIVGGAPTAISLSHHVQGGGPRTVRATHVAEAFHGGELPPGTHKLRRVEPPSMSVDGADGRQR